MKKTLYLIAIDQEKVVSILDTIVCHLGCLFTRLTKVRQNTYTDFHKNVNEDTLNTNFAWVYFNLF